MAAGGRHQARQAAVQALYAWDIGALAPEEVEASFLSLHELAGADADHFRALIRGVPRHRQELEARLEPCLDRQFAMVDPVERAILRVAAFELLHCPRVPPSVVLDEAVLLARDFGAEHSYRFVNGVLDKLLRELRQQRHGSLT